MTSLAFDKELTMQNKQTNITKTNAATHSSFGVFLFQKTDTDSASQTRNLPRVTESVDTAR